MKTIATKKQLVLSLAFFSISIFGNIKNGIAAVDYYVSTTGSNTNSGTTSTAPFKTIAKAVSMLTTGTGSTVHVAPGTYAETILNTKNGTTTSRIRFVSDVKWGAKIVPPSGGTAKTAFDNRGAYVTIDGFEIDGKSLTQWTVGINVGGTSDSVINCHTHHIYKTGTGNSGGGAGILLDSWYGFNNMHAYGNFVHDIGPSVGGSWYQGIYQTATGSIKNNIVYAISGAGIHLWHNANHIDIVNNTSFGSAIGLVMGGGDPVNSYTGLCDYVNVINNICYDNSIYGFSEQGNKVGTHNTFKNNLSFKNGTNFSLNTSAHTADVTTDPQFVNYIKAGGGDYHLKSTSSAIDKGISTYAPSKDYDGVARPQGGIHDIGAYEYIGNTCVAPSVPNGPSSLTAVASTNKIDLTWVDNSGLESAYIIERSVNGTTFTQIASLPPNTTTYSNTGLTANTKYYYRVMATNCFGNSAYSTIVNATTTISTAIEEYVISPINIYPNPFITSFTVNIPSEIILKDAIMKIVDLSGRDAKTVFIINNETIIDRGELPGGIYFYQILNDNITIGQGKLLMQ